MDTKEIQLITNKIFEDFDNNSYKSALNIIFISCVEKVGFNKELLIKSISEFSDYKKLEELAGQSIIKKQVLKSLLELDNENLALILKSLTDFILSLESDNDEIAIEKYKEKIVPNTGYVDYSMYKNLKFAHQDDVDEYLEVEVGDIEKIKLTLDEDSAFIEELFISNIGAVEILFEYDNNTKEEFKENIEKYIYGLKQVIKNSEKIIESLYNASLKICKNWVDTVIPDMDFVKKNTRINSITLYEDYICIDASVWNEETDEDYLCGHGLVLNIEPSELDKSNLDDRWVLVG